MKQILTGNQSRVVTWKQGRKEHELRLSCSASAEVYMKALKVVAKRMGYTDIKMRKAA